MYLFLLLLKKRMQNVAVILKTIDGIWGGGDGQGGDCQYSKRKPLTAFKGLAPERVTAGMTSCPSYLSSPLLDYT